jgi:hypothetical protein
VGLQINCTIWKKISRRRVCTSNTGILQKDRKDYSLIALTGQVSTQAPQSMQLSASITLLSPASAIAPTGQESSHAPQLMHSSEMV